MESAITPRSPSPRYPTNSGGRSGGDCVIPNPLVDPTGFALEQERLRETYAEAYAEYFGTDLPDNGVPARFTVHVVDVPDTAASYEFYGTALLQRSLQRQGRAEKRWHCSRHGGRGSASCDTYRCRNVRGALVTRSGLPFS